MPLDFDSSEDVSAGGAFVTQPGTYHAIVVDSQEEATDRDGKPLGGFRITAQVLAGTVAGEKGKQFDLILFHPKASDKNEGAYAKKKQTRCLISLAKMKPADAGKRMSIDLTPEQTTGRQFVATLERPEGKNYLALAYADIFHVDDPQAAAFPKDQKMIAMLPAEWRLKPEDFGDVDSKPSQRSGGPNGNGSAGTTTQRQPATSVNLDDI